MRKGLIEWLLIWKLNGFKIVNGEIFKNMDKWINFDKLCDKKYIEF